MSRTLISLTIIIVIIITAFGCSNERTANPVENSLSANFSGNASNQRMLWGLWTVEIDKTNGQVNIVPFRNAMFNVNVVNFLHPPFSPVNQLGIQILPGSDIPNGYLEVDVTLKHPFPGLNQYSGFDVRGIFMADASLHSQHDSNIVYADKSGNEAYLLNPDGHTRWWNFTEFTDPMDILSFNDAALGNDANPLATLNPYKYFADDLPYSADVSELEPATRGIFTPSSPATHKRLYLLQFPTSGGSPQIIFNYAVDASWSEPDPSYAPNYPTESFPDGAQVHEPYHILADTSDSTLWYKDSNSGGNLKIDVEIFDWQALQSSNGVEDEISSIWIESPVMNSPVDILPISSISAGAQSTSSVFSAEIDSSFFNITQSGNFEILITVESSDPTNYQPQLPGGENFVFPDVPLAAYKFAQFEIGDTPPIGNADDVTGDFTISVQRNSSKSIVGINASWTENGSPYYAIYADENPFNGISPDVFVGETTASPLLIDSSLWSSFSTDGSYVFAVKGRLTSGADWTDSPNFSQYAFVDMEDFDGGSNPAPWIFGYGNSSYKWEITSTGLIDGTKSIRCNQNMLLQSWSVIASEVIPSISDSGKSFLEFCHIATVTSGEKAFSGGFTHSVPPTGVSTYYDYDTTQDFYAIMDGTFGWVPPCGPPPGCGWTALIQKYNWNYPTSTFFGWRLYDCPHGTADLTRMNFPDYRTDAGTIRAALAWAGPYQPTSDTAWLEVDEIAVVVY